MPIHDWSRVDSGVFHDFHQAWIIELRNRLNDGMLPPDYYALAEQYAQGPIPDVITLESKRRFGENYGVAGDAKESRFEDQAAAVAVAEHPPAVSHTHSHILDKYADKATRVAIHHVSGDEVVGYIEIVSPGNKHSESAIRRFCEKLENAFENGCHALVIDLHRPTPRDPRGLHARFWETAYGGSAPGVTEERPLALVSYQVDLSPTAYFEPTAVGQSLIDMPAFLTPDEYVNVPLEETYQQAWRGVPRRWKEVIEADG